MSTTSATSSCPTIPSAEIGSSDYSGPTASLDRALDQLEHSLGLTQQVEAMRLLELSPPEVARLDAEQCGEGAVVLSQFAFHLQRVLNREATRASWLYAVTNLRLQRYLPLHTYGGWEERRLQAVSHEASLVRLEEERIRSQSRADFLVDLCRRIDSLARSLLELQQTKRRHVQ